jgi:hypothetical protein
VRQRFTLNYESGFLYDFDIVVGTLKLEYFLRGFLLLEPLVLSFLYSVELLGKVSLEFFQEAGFSVLHD